MLIAVNYHYIRERFDLPYPSIFGVTPEQFSEQIDILGKNARFLSITDIVDIIEGRTKLPKRSVVVTLDDGLREQYELALPILKEKGIPAIFFVNTEPIEEDFVTTTHKIHIIRAYTPPDKLLMMLKSLFEKENISLDLPDSGKANSVYKYDTPEAAQIKYLLNYILDEKQQIKIVNKCFDMLGFDNVQVSKDLYMTKNMVRELANLDALGTHGHAHRPLGLLSDDEAIADFETSIKILKEMTGFYVRAFSYPFGFYEACSTAVAQYATNNHIKFAFTMERAANKDIDVPMFLGRFTPNDVFDNNSKIDEFYNGIIYTNWFC